MELAKQIVHLCSVRSIDGRYKIQSRNSYLIISEFATDFIVNSRMNMKFKVNSRNSQWSHSQFAEKVVDSKCIHEIKVKRDGLTKKIVFR